MYEDKDTMENRGTGKRKKGYGQRKTEVRAMENMGTRYGKFGYALYMEKVPQTLINTDFFEMLIFPIDIYRLYRFI